MTDQDLRRQVEKLFSDTGPEPEAEKPELPLEEDIVGLLASETEPDATAAGRTPVEALPVVLAQPEEHREPDETPSGSARWRAAPLASARTRILRTLLHIATVVGGALLIVLLFRLIWHEPMPWPGLYFLFLVAYAAIILIPLIQWMINASLRKTLRETYAKHHEATRTQAILKERAKELASANAPLQKRVLHLETALHITQAVASQLGDLDELLERAVNIVSERFDFHHVSLFLTDESGQWAVLRAATGRTYGHTIVQGYRVEVDHTSTVGWCISNDQIRTAPTPGIASGQGMVETDAMLPETRSEVALPMHARSRVIGALKVETTERPPFPSEGKQGGPFPSEGKQGVSIFPPEDVAILQMIADHIGVAVDHTQTFAKLRARIQEIETGPGRHAQLQGLYSGASRAAPSYERTRPGVTSTGNEPRCFPSYGKGATPNQNAADQIHHPTDDNESENETENEPDELRLAIEKAVMDRQAVVQSNTGDGNNQACFVVPISLRGEVFGALGLHETERKRQWTNDEIALVEAVADQMALAIENARLLEETQQRAEQEQALSQMTARFTRSLDVDALLQTAVRELGQLLRTDEISVYVGTPPADGTEETEQ